MDLRKLNITFSVLGILLASYLLYSQVSLPEFQPCSINENVNCDAVIFGEVSKVLGIPTPLYGLAGFILILFSTIYKKYKIALGAGIFGFLFCLRLIIIEVLKLGVYCPICLACQILMIGVIVISFNLIKDLVNPIQTELK